ncbi:MAG: sporulation protein YqfD [Clostridiales bacterium]|nr:sporulation protein YqfD [Clostridiales bacterium]
MFLHILWNFLIGYVVIQVEGLSLEKFINLTVVNNIYLWGIRRQSYAILTAKVNIRDFRQLRHISRKIRCRIRIVDKKGLPFILYRYRNRKMLAVGMVLFLIIIFGLSSFVWTVEVEGVESVNQQKLLSELYELGVRPGVPKASIDTLYIENQLVIRISGLSWASLEIRGSKAILRVKESVPPPALVKKDKPSNIVAAKDGIIESMIVLDGQAVVKEGQTVKKGQLLVSGAIDHPDTNGVRYVYSMARIMARTWYEEKVVLSLKEPYRFRTGRKAEVRYIGWERLKIPYYKEEVPFFEYDLIVENDGIFIKEIYHEVEIRYWDRDIQKAKKKLEEMADQTVKNSIPPGAKIVDKKLKYDMIESDKIIAVIYIEALEDIAMQQSMVN